MAEKPVPIPVAHKEGIIMDTRPAPALQPLQPVVIVRFSPSPNVFHLVEVQHEGREPAKILVRGDCDRRVVATFAAAIAGFGPI